MEENRSPLKSGRSARSAGGKAPKGQKEAQRDSGKPGGRNKEGVSRVRDEGQGSHGGGGRTLAGSPQDQGRASKSRRLTGRTNSGERGKGKPGAQQAEGRQQAQDGKAMGKSRGTRGHMAHQVVHSAPEGNSSHSRPSKLALARDKPAGEVSGRAPAECIPDVMGSVDEGNLTSDQELGLKQAEERLQRDYIHRLVKQSPEYPNYQYLCKLCSVHVDNIQGAHKHIKEKRHKKNIMADSNFILALASVRSGLWAQSDLGSGLSPIWAQSDLGSVRSGLWAQSALDSGLSPLWTLGSVRSGLWAQSDLGSGLSLIWALGSVRSGLWAQSDLGSGLWAQCSVRSGLWALASVRSGLWPLYPVTALCSGGGFRHRGSWSGELMIRSHMEKQEENELRALPVPSAAQMRAVDAAVMETARQYGISEEDFQQRQSVLQRMEKIIQKHLPACSLRLYGSCLTRFAFKTSDINIDVAYPSNMTQPDVLIQVLDILKKSAEFSEVESDFHAKVPVVLCCDAASGLLCKVSAGNDVACLTTNHLAALARLEPRLVPLVLAFRYWAKLCHIDCQAEGGIPSYSFSLMVIFFLQQKKQPILPVYLGHWVEGFDVKRVDEYHLTGVQTEGYVGWEHRPGSANDSRDNKNKPEAQKPAEKSENVKGKSRLVLDKSEATPLGQLWLELLRFYTLEFALEDYIISIRLKELLPRDAKNWPRRRLAIEDPFALKRNVARSLNSQMVFEYIQECFRMAYRYFACPQSRNGLRAKRAKHRAKASRAGRADRVHSRSDRAHRAQNKRVEDQDGGGSSGEEDEENKEEDNEDEEEEEEEDEEAGEDEQRVSRGLARLLVTDQQDGDASHDPSSPSPSPQNGLLLDSEDEEQEEEGRKAPETEHIAPEDLHYVFDRMIFTGGKLHPDGAHPQEPHLVGRLGIVRHANDSGFTFDHRPLPRLSLTPRHRHQRLQWCRTRLSWSDSEWQRVIFSDESRFSLGGDAQRIRVWRHRGQHRDGRSRRRGVTPPPPLPHHLQELCEDVQAAWDGLSQDTIRNLYSSIPRRLACWPPTVVCSICKRDGHLKDDCPEDFKKMELAPLPAMTEHFREILDGLCRLCYHELSPTLGEQQKREQILASLERFIRKEYNDKAQLCLFGSSKNGFGFRDSDLDICMTLEGHDTAEKLNCKEIIEGLAKVLKKHTGLRNILPITTAKVPIVKFEHKQSGLEGDISLYNTLRPPPDPPAFCSQAQHNTRMLATYAALDPRVQFLGYTMKVFAKRCDIGDASRGSLSSYAYILMVLYFLQQRQPPVIPVLQEIYDGSSMPQRMVDGWNAFFFDDLEELRRRLPEFQQNRETVGELWLGLLRFYTEEFDFKEHVISIRQRKRLTTFEKQWTSKCIAIEDPFDLNHNLGAGVSRKMTNFIMKAFINGRKLFGTPFYPQPGMEAEYFFDSKVLTDGELAPNDRCCRICGKIGHYMKDCPKRRRMKKKENDKDEEVREEDREPRERRCFQCGDMGHVRRDCPDYRHLRQRGAPAPVPQMVRSMVSSQAIPIPQIGASQDRPGRTRQPSECSDTRQTPPYSPQPSSFSQSSVSPQSSQSIKPSSSGSSSGAPSKPLPPPQQQQVQLSVFGFAPSHPGQYHPALGLLQPHGQPAPAQLPPGSWPLHGATAGVKFPMRKAKGNGEAGQQAVNPTTVNLNDPSIIFAQPAGRGGNVGGAARDGGHHWHNHHLNPGALVANGTVGKAVGPFGGCRPCRVYWLLQVVPTDFQKDPNLGILWESPDVWMLLNADDASQSHLQPCEDENRHLGNRVRNVMGLTGFQAAFGGVAPGARSWEHSSAAGSYSLSPTWAYRMPQTYMQQPSKPFISQGAVANQHFPLLPPGRHVNLSYVQQKK
ncbi:hypothetical protein NFI96_025619 [Prochilodus magdalenae]|nr:hypothetical protein NFI96_025619 [Prochilodus magdalenae]